MDGNNSPVIFCITIQEETRYYRNDDMSLNDLIQRYSECKRPFIELGETSQRIDTIQFVELEQTLGTTSIEIVPDENRVTVYENKGNDVYENEFDNEFEEYKLSELLEQLEKIEIAPESEKSTITVDEDDILRMSAKIKQNQEEDIRFSNSIDKYLSNPDTETQPLVVGTTSNALAISGANPNLDVVINPRTIRKCMSEPDEHFHGHALSKELIKQIPSQLRNPVMVFKGSTEKSLVVITELKDKKNKGVIVALSLASRQGFSEVNRISSAYGKNNLANYLFTQIQNNNLIAVNRKKADRMLHSTGLQLPKENTFFSFNNSISYSMQNVKIPEQNLQVNKEKADQVLHSKGLLKINNGYYRTLPREDRTIEVVPAQHAAEIMQQLADKGIEFSAVSRKNDKAAITVHIEHKSDLASAAENTVKGQIQKNQPTVSKTASKEIINPDYFKQLKSSERHIQRLPSGDADKIIASLESKGVQFSAVKGEKLTSITVHKDDRAAVGQAVHENNRAAAKEYINSDYFKSLPPEQRVYSQTADLNAAKTLMNALDSEAVQYSAVIDNEKSNARITIAKQDIPKAQKTGFLFSRQAQKSFTEKAQTQNNEREATRVSEHKKENHTI